MLEAELHRKESQSFVLKRANKASSKAYQGVGTEKFQQTDIVGLKGRLIQFTEQQY